MADEQTTPIAAAEQLAAKAELLAGRVQPEGRASLITAAVDGWAKTVDPALASLARANVQRDVEAQLDRENGELLGALHVEADALDAALAAQAAREREAPDLLAHLQRLAGRGNSYTMPELVGTATIEELKRLRLGGELAAVQPSTAGRRYEHAVAALAARPDDLDAIVTIRHLEATHADGWIGARPANAEEVEAAARLVTQIRKAREARISAQTRAAQDQVRAARHKAQWVGDVAKITPRLPGR
ncbi:MAG TPA: hypothetical protein VFX12_01315 [Vicinamibacterales bacterium]|nr:hypothetical protein [Vicinamibacterales bacterium]